MLGMLADESLDLIDSLLEDILNNCSAHLSVPGTTLSLTLPGLDPTV